MRYKVRSGATTVMKTVIITRKFKASDDIKERIKKKLSKLDKFFSPDTEAKVALKEEGGKVRIEVTIRQGGAIFRAEEEDKELYNAIDRVQEVLDRQIKKYHKRLEKKMHFTKETFADIGEDEEEEDELVISKVKRFAILPLTVEEAILQMNLLSHSFFLFRNAETGLINLVYKRKGNAYGVIEPTE